MNNNGLSFKENFKNAGLSVAEFAKRANVAESTVYNWLRGGVIPASKSTAVRSFCLNTTPNALFSKSSGFITWFATLIFRRRG